MYLSCAALRGIRSSLPERLNVSVEKVAHAALGTQQIRISCICLQFSAQPENLYVDRSVKNVVKRARSLQQLLAANDAAWRSQKNHKQIELGVGQRKLCQLRRYELASV